MKYSLYTNETAFAKEMNDVVNLFFQGAEFELNLSAENAYFTVFHTESIENNIRYSQISIEGSIKGRFLVEEKITNEVIENKRLHKRQVKRGLYYALIEATGKTIPWGSLTGVRPTRLVYERLEKGFSLDDALKYIKTVFDVSDEKLNLLKEIVLVQKNLKKPQKNDIDVYVGIPYCASRCRYCSFISSLVPSYSSMLSYTEALEKEIRAAIEIIKNDKLKIRAFYMGGGTPTALPLDLLKAVLKECGFFIENAIEACVEAGRPDTIDVNKLELIKAVGIKRISINPQTMHNSTLEIIGRKHTVEQSEQAYALARKVGIGSINMDLIAGLPNENIDMFMQTLAWAKKMAPESLTVHSLSIKRSSDTHLFKDSLPKEDLVRAMIDSALVHAKNENLSPYYVYRQKNQAGNLENIGFSKAGHECLYNIDMMEETCDVIALGAGAISKCLSMDNKKLERSPNIKQVQDYVAKITEMIARKKVLFCRT